MPESRSQENSSDGFSPIILNPMTNPSSIPSGSWPSWVAPDLVAGRSVSLSELQAAGDSLYWLEGRPQEKGRTALVSVKRNEAPQDLLPVSHDVGSRVHEYGGGAYRVSPTQRVVFSDRRTGHVWLRETDGSLVPLASSEGCSYAEFSFDSVERGVFCIREDQRSPGEARAAIVWLDHQRETVLVQGDDFYAAPRPAPDDRHLVWVAWSHPDMPWDATKLSIASLTWQEDIPHCGTISVICGHSIRCSSVDPVWETAQTLLASCDESGFWRPYRFSVEAEQNAVSLPDPGGETGFPHWVFGQRSLNLLPNGRLMAQIVTEGVSSIAVLESDTWARQPELDAAHLPVAFGDELAWIDSPPDAPPAVVIGDRHNRIRQAFTFPQDVNARDCAAPTALPFPTGKGETAHALYYAPVNRHHTLADGEQPPLVVMAHGGPTARASSAFSFKVQWWTSRGFAVLDVNYRGSTGFGRAYRRALEGQWGVVDVQDCIAAVRHVTAQGLADPKRCVIRGSSAGGLTVLMALASSSVFAAGCSLYGVTDLRALAGDTHKFESRYLDRLIGPYPEQEDLYLTRSPLSHVAEITAPVLFLHGNLDKVVPLAQAQAMYDGMLALGRHSELHVYDGEGHGFRQEHTLKDSFSRELAFYLKVFGQI